MAGHGGERRGAGAPRGGISQTKRIVLAAMERGFAMAGRAKGLKGTQEEVATQAAALVISDMILAGDGRSALALWVTATPKGEEGGNVPKSSLSAALDALPGMLKGPRSALPGEVVDAEVVNSQQSDARAPDPQSVTPIRGPFFAPQQPLFPPSLEPLPPGVDGASTGEASTAGGPGVPPGPGSGPSPHGSHLRTENFEKISERKDDIPF